MYWYFAPSLFCLAWKKVANNNKSIPNIVYTRWKCGGCAEFIKHHKSPEYSLLTLHRQQTDFIYEPNLLWARLNNQIKSGMGCKRIVQAIDCSLWFSMKWNETIWMHIHQPANWNTCSKLTTCTLIEHSSINFCESIEMINYML